LQLFNRYTSDYTIESKRLFDTHTSLHLFGCHRHKVKSGWKSKEDAHYPGIEINYQLEGMQDIKINSNNYTLNEGDLVIIPPGSIHSSEVTDLASSSSTFFVLHFTIDNRQFHNILTNSSQIYYPAYSHMVKEARPILYRLMEINETHPTLQTTHLKVQSIMFNLLVVLEEVFLQQKHIVQPNSKKSELATEILSEINKLVENYSDHNRKSGNIEKIAKTIGISTSYCSRVFRDVYGISPRDYILFLRAEQAVKILLNSPLSIEEIALSLGYCDAAEFSKQFKKNKGISPGRFRSLMSKEIVPHHQEPTFSL